MKKVFIFLGFFLISLTSCKDDCVTSSDAACNDEVPTNEVCLAFFTRWFYDSSTSTCEQIGYSGCEQLGFETKEACEACECN